VVDEGVELRQAISADRDSMASQVARLEAAFDEIVQGSDLVATDDEHDPEGHTIAFERQQIAALLRDARTRLADLDAALARIEEGSYGTCADCGERIGEERLRALPGAVRCFDCADRLG
jgi:DnaK suppressor protein